MKYAVVYEDSQGALRAVAPLSESAAATVRDMAEADGYSVSGVIPAETYSEFRLTVTRDRRGAANRAARPGGEPQS